MVEKSTETIAIEAFTFLVSERDRIENFLKLTGIDQESLAARVSEPDFLAGVLDHLMSDDALILTFCANSGHHPNDVARAHSRLLAAQEPGWEV